MNRLPHNKERKNKTPKPWYIDCSSERATKHTGTEQKEQFHELSHTDYATDLKMVGLWKQSKLIIWQMDWQIIAYCKLPNRINVFERPQDGFSMHQIYPLFIYQHLQ